MTLEDSQLLVRTSRGDETAARALWSRHGPALVAYARAILGPAHAHHADDVVQNVMCSILEAPAATLREVRDARSWLSTATRRLCLNTLRSAGRGKRRAAAAAAERASRGAEAGPGEAAGPELSAALDHLPRRLREVVYLRHAASLTFDEIALSLNRSRSTLSTQYQRAIELLRGMLERPHQPGPVRDPDEPPMTLLASPAAGGCS